MHPYTCPCTYMNMHMNINVYICMCMVIPVRACVRVPSCSRVCTRMCAWMFAWRCVYMSVVFVFACFMFLCFGDNGFLCLCITAFLYFVVVSFCA